MEDKVLVLQYLCEWALEESQDIVDAIDNQEDDPQFLVCSLCHKSFFGFLLFFQSEVDTYICVRVFSVLCLLVGTRMTTPIGGLGIAI